MKKIIELSQNQANDFYHCKFEVEVSEFPSVLKKDVCESDCLQIRRDKTKKNLVIAERLVEMDGKKKDDGLRYKCLRCSSDILKDPENISGFPIETIKIHNPQDLEDIRKEIRKHE